MPPSHPSVIVPVRSFNSAKQRLGTMLSPSQRAELARVVATRVVLAARPWPVLVVCDHPDVQQWALELGAEPVSDPGSGLNAAVAAGVDAAREAGAQRVVILHGDLPLVPSLPQTLGLSGAADAVLIAPDLRRDGTNLLSISTHTDFSFSYGVGSFAAHRAEATRRGLQVVVRSDRRLGLDLDLPDDVLRWIDIAPEDVTAHGFRDAETAVRDHPRTGS